VHLIPARAAGPWWWESARFQALLLASSWFRQSGGISSRLVVEPVETHQRVTPTVGQARRFTMKILDYLTIILFGIWCVSEIVIGLVSLRNRSRDLSEGRDRFSYFIVWFSTVPAIFIAYLTEKHLIFANGFGSFSTLIPLLGYLGCSVMVFGITIRLVAVATLKRQFTVKVSIIEKHEIVDTGIYGIIRHPAYLGHLASLLGIGLILGNWVGLTVLVVLPLAGILYRIHVEERALLRHFGHAYREYTSRTKKLLPGIW
jgi:protein-S-isoprenylcysteine O-methyltransferase Ste14